MINHLQAELSLLTKMKNNESKIITLNSDLAYYQRNNLVLKKSTSAEFFFGELYCELNRLYSNKVALLGGVKESAHFLNKNNQDFDISMLVKRKSKNQFEIHFKLSDVISAFNDISFYNDNPFPKMAWLYLWAIAELGDSYQESFIHLFNYKMNNGYDCVTPSLQEKSYLDSQHIEFYHSDSFIMPNGSLPRFYSIFTNGNSKSINWTAQSLFIYQEVLPNDNMNDLKQLLQTLGFDLESNENKTLLKLIADIETNEEHPANQMWKYQKNHLTNRIYFWKKLQNFNKNQLFSLDSIDEPTKNIFFVDSGNVCIETNLVEFLNELLIKVVNFEHENTRNFMFKMLQMGKNFDYFCESNLEIPIANSSFIIQTKLTNNQWIIEVPLDLFFVCQNTSNINNHLMKLLSNWIEQTEEDSNDIFYYPSNLEFVLEFSPMGLQMENVKINAKHLKNINGFDFLKIHLDNEISCNDILKEIDVDFHKIL